MLVAVSGSRGFIGSAVCEELKRRDHEPMGFDLPFHDIRYETSFNGANAIIHLAGMLGTHELFDTINEAIDTNIKGTANVLDIAHRENARYVGITMPHVFPSIYTATKIAAEQFERAYHYTYGVPVSRVRAFNAFGPGQKHGPGHPQKIVPTFATEAWAGRPIPIWGDGTQTVDLIYVDDLASLLVDALEYGDDFTIDAGTRHALTVNEVAQMVLDITDSKAGITYLPMRRGEIPRKITARGEGWERALTRRPVWNMVHFVKTVQSYKELLI